MSNLVFVRHVIYRGTPQNVAFGIREKPTPRMLLSEVPFGVNASLSRKQLHDHQEFCSVSSGNPQMLWFPYRPYNSPTTTNRKGKDSNMDESCVAFTVLFQQYMKVG